MVLEDENAVKLYLFPRDNEKMDKPRKSISRVQEPEIQTTLVISRMMSDDLRILDRLTA